MDLPAAINSDKQALLRIVAGLFAMLGLNASKSGSQTPQRIARSLHGMIGFVLRPAESAVRRLIVLVSLTLRPRAVPVRAMPAALPDVLAGSSKGKSNCAFQLFDPRLRLVNRGKKPAKKARAMPRISFFRDGEVHTIALGSTTPKNSASDGLIEPAALLRRLAALKSALDDLPRQARRLARALARRQKIPRLKWQGPMRPGHPPGHRVRRRHEIEEILQRCHWLAREALPDTS